MAANHETALEAKQEVLAARLDLLEPLSVDTLGDPQDSRPWMR